MKSLVIASNTSGGGKTTFTLGLMKALKNRGYKIQGYKSGPDYIDPSFHTEITGVVSRNLDIYLMGRDGVLESYGRGAGDFGIIEGVMGLYDGKGIGTEYSTYHLAKVLNDAPILLVITPKAQSLTLAAEIKGLKEFRDANIVGVVLNNIGEGYYNLLKPMIEKECNLKVFGYLKKDERIELKSRHLGLVQSVEVNDLEYKIEICANLIEEGVDLDSLIENFKEIKGIKGNFKVKNRGIKIGVAYDEAFRFYYKENLEILEETGKVIYFSPIKDRELPKGLDFLYIGGGYPEIFKKELSKNKDMLNSIKTALENGLKCYAECGGLMYLTDEIDGYNMVSFLDGKSFMTGKLNRFGYSTVKTKGIEINCHEFHKSDVEVNEKKSFKVSKTAIDGSIKTWECGYIKENVIAGYPHIHFFGNMKFLEYLLEGIN